MAASLGAASRLDQGWTSSYGLAENRLDSLGARRTDSVACFASWQATSRLHETRPEYKIHANEELMTSTNLTKTQPGQLGRNR